MHLLRHQGTLPWESRQTTQATHINDMCKHQRANGVRQTAQEALSSVILAVVHTQATSDLDIKCQRDQADTPTTRASVDYCNTKGRGWWGCKTPFPPPTNPPPFQLSKSSGWWFMTVHDSAYLIGVHPSLWGTHSTVYPPLLALDPLLNKALGPEIASLPKSFVFHSLLFFPVS